jgi:hypothetical protein
VTVRPRAVDRYGRTVAEVVLPDGRDLGRELVRAGLAWWYRKYAPGDYELARLEAEARGAKRGVWSQAGAVPPWEWRRGGGSSLPPGLAGKVVGNRRSRVFHAPGCPAVVRMAGQNRTPFDSAAAAAAAGFRAARDCQPES